MRDRLRTPPFCCSGQSLLAALTPGQTDEPRVVDDDIERYGGSCAAQTSLSMLNISPRHVVTAHKTELLFPESLAENANALLTSR